MHSWDNMSMLYIDSPRVKPPPAPPPPPPPPTTKTRPVTKSNGSSTSSSLESSESEELQRLVHAPPFWKSKKKLSKQLSMCETHRDVAWERRRRQILRKEKRKSMVIGSSEDLTSGVDLTDEDLNELRGSIELGFGFSEEACQKLCHTLPALDLYFAVNRQLSPSPVSTPHSASNGSTSGSMGARSSSFDSPKSEDSWKICSPGDNPQQVKMRLRHWAQAVACSVMQTF